jgi:hypothetical protein
MPASKLPSGIFDMDIFNICAGIIGRYRFKDDTAKEKFLNLCRERLDSDDGEYEKVLRSGVSDIKEYLLRYFHMPRFSTEDEINRIIRKEADCFLYSLDDFDDALTRNLIKAVWEIYLTERIFVSAKGIENRKKYSTAVYNMF